MKQEAIKKAIKEQRRLLLEFIEELNGKYMDYKSCRMLEQFIDQYIINTVSLTLRLKIIKQELTKGMDKK